MKKSGIFLLLLMASSWAVDFAQTTTYVNVTVASSPQSPAVTVYPSFSGLSFEKSQIDKAQGTSWGNSPVQAVFKSLGLGE
jgi:hypothetical protein